MADPTPPVEYKKGSTSASPGEGQPLPEGGATEANQQVAAATHEAQSGLQGAQGGPEGAAPVPGGQEAANGAPGAPENQEPIPQHLSAAMGGEIPEAPVTYTPQTDQEKFMFGGGPNQGPPPGHALDEGPLQVPESVVQGLPALQLAANMPGASAQVRALFAYVTYHLSRK